MTLALERLERRHRRLLGAFENDSAELVAYLRRWALAHQERDHLSTTWLAVDHGAEGVRLAGYFSLAAATVERSTIPDVGDLGKLPRFPVPAILLARLAVDSRVKGQGVGTWMFDELVQMSVAIAAEGPIGVRLIVTDAKDHRSFGFYAKRGMTSVVSDGWPRRMVIDLRPIVGSRKTLE